MDESFQLMRRTIAELGGLMFARHLTDTAGGNISARVGDRICITAKQSGGKYRWQLRPEQVLVTDMQGNKIEGDGEISRESKVHFRLLNAFPEGSAVVHGHARNVLVFCAAGIPIPPVLENTHKLGMVKLVPYAPAGTPALAENVYQGLLGQEERVRSMAAAVIAPWHGLFVLGKDLDAAFDAAERIDTNARCLLLSGAFNDPVLMASRMRELNEVMASFGPSIE